jgi:hypothetical protein
MLLPIARRHDFFKRDRTVARALVLPPIAATKSGDPAAGVLATMTRINAMIEAWVRTRAGSIAAGPIKGDQLYSEVHRGRLLYSSGLIA